MLTRNDIVKFAMKYAGSSALNDRSEEYLDLLSRGKETPQMRKDMGLMSSCALFVRSVWWFLGMEHRVYDSPYVNGRAPADVLSIAKEKGAYMAGMKLSNNCYPREGDTFYLATSDGKREHFGIVSKEFPCPQDGTWKFETVEGGQGPGGRAIEKCFRTMVKKGSWGSVGDRLLVGWIDSSKLNLPGVRMVPSGYKEDPYSSFDEQATTAVEVPSPEKKKRKRSK